jgi:hypothetical protein
MNNNNKIKIIYIGYRIPKSKITKIQQIRLLIECPINGALTILSTTKSPSATGCSFPKPSSKFWLLALFTSIL